MSSHHPGSVGRARSLLLVLAFGLIVIQSVGMANLATSTTTTHTRTRVTTTATVTETTTATTSTLGSRSFLILVVLLATAASVAVVGGYVWGKRRTRKNLLGS